MSRNARSTAPNNQRRGIQLLELVVSLVSTSILFAGITTSILVANKSMAIATSRQAGSMRNAAGFDRLRTDLAEAYPASSRSASSVTLSVGDRNNDGLRESIQYRWTGLGAPLEMSINSGNWLSVTRNLDQFTLDWRTCPPQSVTTSASLDSLGTFPFRGRSIASAASTSSINLVPPETYQNSGDLLVAVISVNGYVNDVNTTSPGWVKAGQRIRVSGSGVTLAVFYSIAHPVGATLPITWTGSRAYYATIAHFGTPTGTAKLSSFSLFDSTGQYATAPAGTASVGNALVLRALAGTGPLVGEEMTNMPGHIAITLRNQLLTDPIVGLCYRSTGVGSIPDASFGLPSSANYVTATLVFQP